MGVEDALAVFVRQIVREELATLRPAAPPANDGAPAGEYADEKAVAAWLGISRVKLQQDRAHGRGLPFVRVGTAVRYHVPSVRAHVAAHGFGTARRAGRVR